MVMHGMQRKNIMARAQLSQEDLEMERKVMLERRKGRSYREIAVTLGLSGPGQANKIFTRALLRHTADIAPDIKRLEHERLDELQAAIYDQALAGDLKAVEAVLRIMERRARYEGLDHTDKMAAAQLKIEADKVRVMALALGRALDAINLTDSQKEQAMEVMHAQMKQLIENG